MNDNQSCGLLNKLAVELRIKIFEEVLKFDRPIKLRQYVAGSANTAILRTNKQVHWEARSVLHDINTVSVTRNDFCIITDASIKTPVDGQHVRHLRFTSFGGSIACNSLQERCPVCEDSAAGLLQALKDMPLLRSVVIDYKTQVSNFKRFWDYAHENSTSFAIECVGVGVYRLRGDGFDEVDFKLHHRPLATSWPAIDALSRSCPSIQQEEAELSRLRSIDAKLPGMLCALFSARLSGHLQFMNPELDDLWTEADEEQIVADRSRSSAMHRFTVASVSYTHLTLPTKRIV